MLACVAFLTFQSPSVASPSGGDEGAAFGTVVVWDNFQSGKPTAHLQARLLDCGRVFAQVYARLEDDGCIRGFALTECGVEEIEGEWCFDPCEEEGEFELEFDIGHDDEEIDLEGCFEGTRSFWFGEWEREED
jgi:hypothetical protein